MKYMQKWVRGVHRGQKGFTLIELLVVIAILGAIAAVVVLNVGGFIGRGECEAYCTEKHNLQTAVIAYMAENSGTVPSVALAGTYLLGGSAALSYGWVDGDIDGSTGYVADPADNSKPDGCTKC